MTRCYSVPVTNRQMSLALVALPHLWLISDARNDAMLETALARMPSGSALVYRHYHLAPVERRARFRHLARVARRFGHSVILSGSARQARAWGADGAYGSSVVLAPGPRTVRIATVHGLRELAEARRARADAVMLSPVFPTRSHPGGRVLGPTRFRLIARAARVPVIALGGMTQARARTLRVRRWAAIDGLSGESR